MVVALLATLACSPAKYAVQEAENEGFDASWSVEMGSIESCSNPAEHVSYREAGLELGIDTEAFDPNAPGGHEDGPSIAVGDPNSDGHIDIIITRMTNGVSHIYRGQDGAYADYPDILDPGRSPVFVDMDLDGRLDMLLAGPNPAWVSFDQDLNPTMTPLPPLDDGESASVVHDWSVADFDGDGGLEAVAVRTASPFGQGTVTNDRMIDIDANGPTLMADWVPEEVGLRHGFDAVSFDEDEDGDVDLYIVHDHGATVGPSTLLVNEGDGFVDGADACFCEVSASAKGADIADIDGDGRPELFVTGAPLNTLFSRLESGWVDRSDASGIRDDVSMAAGWGGVFFDWGNDGDVDVLLAQGDRFNPGQTDLPDGRPAAFDEPLRLMATTADGFVDVAPDLGIDVEGSFRAVVAADINQDGVEDLIVTQASERTLVFVSEGCTAANWIRVDAPIGAKVRVTTPSKQLTNWARVGRGYQSSARIPLHFGLGADETVSEIRVQMGKREVRVEGPIDARQTVTVRGPAPLVSGRE